MRTDKVVGFIPRLLYKVFLTLKEKFDPSPKISDEENYAADICSKLIQNPTSELSFSPLTTKRIIKNENLRMYIVMESNTIHLINHVYSYSIYLQDISKFHSLVESFDKILEEKREVLELEIRKNIQNSLMSILDKLK